MGRPKKKIAEMQQVDAKDYTQKPKARTLDEIWGYKLSKYKTDNENEYIKSLSSMNKVDLQKECIRIGLSPNDDRRIMTERLLKQFRIYTACAKTSEAPNEQPKIKNPEEVRRILSNGVSVY